MMEYTLRCRLADGTWQDGFCRMETLAGGLTAVFADTEAEAALDPDLGASIAIDDSEWEQFMADDRYCEFWCRPAFGTKGSQIPGEGQYLLVKLKNGLWRVYVPVVSEDYKCVIRGTEEGAAAVLFSWYAGKCDCRGLAFVTGDGEDPYQLTEDCVKAALKLLNNGCRHRTERRYPEVFEYLGWCSWDAMPADNVNEVGVLQKCREFRDKQIPVRWAILDDMWAQIRHFDESTYENRGEMFRVMHSSHMSDFEASYKRFPNGLAHCLKAMREDYDMIPAMWHPTTGYWMGIEKGSPADEKLAGTTMEAIDGRILGDWHEAKSFQYFNTYHRFFRECGAEFVKVDNQSMYRRFYKGMDTVGKVCREYHRGLEASVGLNFDGTMINCMGMASEDMWNRSSSAISRCSDDFQPENRPWFTKHILQCTYNCLIQGQFYWCDYDMWWTDDSQGPKNSLLRAISGGPIYVSDKLERSRKEILDPLAFADGKILRCDRPGMPAADCLTVDPEQSGAPLKIQNKYGKSGFVAAFNVSKEESPVTGTVSPADVDGLEGEIFAAYEHFTGRVTLLGKDDKIEITLNNHDEYCLYVIVPYEKGFAPIGLLDKFISPAGIVNEAGGEVTLYESGRYGYVKNGEFVIENR
ncbi:MAG: hypothetical protein IKY52_06525 [Clostridia bacterium]|nr:hypothetical protein [Clostridia bacterium]